MYPLLRGSLSNSRSVQVPSLLGLGSPVTNCGFLSSRKRALHIPATAVIGKHGTPAHYTQQRDRFRNRCDTYRGGVLDRPNGITEYGRRTMFSSASVPSAGKPNADPMARRPTKKCDPYGLDGKPLDDTAARQWMATLDDEWFLVPGNGGIDRGEVGTEANDDGGSDEISTSPPPATPPAALQRKFRHPSYLAGARFLSDIVAAVATNQGHHPATVVLEKRIAKGGGAWEFVTTITCSTQALGGLSYHDFHLASGVDVEAGREEARRWLTAERVLRSDS